MMKSLKKDPLYRKVNTKTRFVHHLHGSDYKYDRNTKEEKLKEEEEFKRQTMHKKVNRGLDYTPLFKFLLSKVGKNFDEVFKEAKSRLDKEEPIFYMVEKGEPKNEIFCGNENDYYNSLYIDEEGILRKVNENYSQQKSLIRCRCCTFTFNGKVIAKKKDENKENNEVN
jgi:hypothetical protein